MLLISLYSQFLFIFCLIYSVLLIVLYFFMFKGIWNAKSLPKWHPLPKVIVTSHYITLKKTNNLDTDIFILKRNELLFINSNDILFNVLLPDSATDKTLMPTYSYSVSHSPLNRPERSSCSIWPNEVAASGSRCWEVERRLVVRWQSSVVHMASWSSLS